MPYLPTWPFGGMVIGGVYTVPDKMYHPDMVTMLNEIDSNLSESAKTQVSASGGLKQCILAPFTGGTLPPFTMDIAWFGSNSVTYECLTAFLNFLSISTLSALKTQFGVTQALFTMLSYVTSYYVQIYNFLQFNPADVAFTATETLVAWAGSQMTGLIRKTKDSFYNTMRENGIKDPEQMESWPWSQFLDCPPVAKVLESYQQTLDSFLFEYNKKKYEYKRSYAVLQTLAVLVTWLYFKISMLTNWVNSIDIIIAVKKADPLENPGPGEQRQADRPPTP